MLTCNEMHKVSWKLQLKPNRLWEGQTSLKWIIMIDVIKNEFVIHFIFLNIFQENNLFIKDEGWKKLKAQTNPIKSLRQWCEISYGITDFE